MMLQFEINESLTPYLREEAAKRGITPTRLGCLLITQTLHDKMVLAVLDDEGKDYHAKIKGAGGATRKKIVHEAERMTSEERRSYIIDAIQKHGSTSIYDLGGRGSIQKWYPAIRSLVDDGTIRPMPRERGARLYYELCPVAAHDVPTSASPHVSPPDGDHVEHIPQFLKIGEVNA